MTVKIQELDYSVDLLKYILWQYDSAPNIRALIEKKQEWVTENQTNFWTSWYNDVFNLETANDFGLKVWSIILDLNLFFNTAEPVVEKVSFGFGEFNENFFSSNFGSNNGSTFSLSTEGKRIALRLRAHQIFSSCTIPETNRMLARVFKSYGKAYLLDGLDMTQTYVFDFSLSAELSYILDNFDLLPRSTGVKSSYITTSDKSFGFGEYRENFYSSNFGD